MTEIISLKYSVSIHKKKTIKRRTYETNDPFDVFHIDANDKLKRLHCSRVY